MNFLMHDFASRERKRWIASVSPFHKDELRIKYQLAWLKALVFGSGMPHEKT